MEILLALSDSYSNLAVAHFCGGWGFRESITIQKAIPGNFITFYCTEKETPGVHGLHGLGIITGPQIPGPIKEQYWLDRNYYDFIPFKSLSSKFIPFKIIQDYYGKRWNRDHFIVGSNALPPVTQSEDQLRQFLTFMLE